MRYRAHSLRTAPRRINLDRGNLYLALVIVCQAG